MSFSLRKKNKTYFNNSPEKHYAYAVNYWNYIVSKLFDFLINDVHVKQLYKTGSWMGFIIFLFEIFIKDMKLFKLLFGLLLAVYTVIECN